MKPAILFDLDGTLLDTLPDLLDATNHILQEAGYPPVSQEALRGIIGNGAANQIRKSLPEHTPESVVQALLPKYRDYYAAHCRIKTKPYPSICEALEQLKDYPMAIVSNKPDAAVKSLCEAFFPGVLAIGETSDCPRKPAPDMIRKALACLGVEHCIYVGDSEVDLHTAANAACPCLSVTWGFREREALIAAGADHLCPRPDRLSAILQGMLLDA